VRAPAVREQVGEQHVAVPLSRLPPHLPQALDGSDILKKLRIRKQGIIFVQEFEDILLKLCLLNMFVSLSL